MQIPRLMRNKWVNVAIVTAFMLFFVWSIARSEEVVFSGGAPALRGVTPAVDVSWRIPTERGAYFQTSLTLVGESTHEGEYQANNAALQALYVSSINDIDLGIGVALLQNTDRYNGSRANFALQLGYNFGRCYVQYRHWSNAGTVKPNLGRDILLVGYRF